MTVQREFPSISVKSGYDATDPKSHAVLYTAVVGFTVVSLLLDVASDRLNLAVLYLVPLFLQARVSAPRLIVIWAVLLVALTYGGYLLKVVWITPESLWSYRLLNRTLVASAIVLTSVLLVQFARWRDELQNRTPEPRHRDADQVVYDEVIDVVERIVVGAACALYILTVAIGDSITPAQYNLPILYSVPVVLSGLTKSRLFLWSLTSVVLILVPAGYLIGPPLTLPDTLIAFISTNRAIAALAIAFLAFFVHVWIGRVRPANLR